MKSKNDFQRWEIHPQNGSQLRNPTPDLMDICFVFFREIPKGSILGGVSMWLTVGSKKKKKLALNFLMDIHLRERFFSVEIRFCFSFLLQNPKYVFQDFTPDLQIESTQNFRAAFKLYSTSIRSYFGLFWIEIRFKSFLWFTFNKMHLSDVRSGAYITWVLGH